MPTYEYECERCGKSFERFQNMTDQPVRKCPDCGGRVKRLISGGSGFIMKGEGGRRSAAACTRETPCCGRETPCDVRPCDN